MSRSYKIILILLVLLLAVLTFLEANEPQEVNWSPSFSAKDKIPLGAFVLFENLQEQSFPVETLSIPPFEFLNDSTPEGTYFFLNDQLFMDDHELEKLFDWISKGNTAFLIAESFSGNILDILNLKTEVLLPEKGISSKSLLNLTQEEFQQDGPFLYNRENYNVVFSHEDSLRQEVLGEVGLVRDSVNQKTLRPNFIRDSIGQGAIYLHSMPQAFSNYFLLSKDNSKYAERALAYIPPQKPLFWDQYYKAGKTFNTSPLYILLNDRSLRWAYYFVVIAAILFVIFEGKRKQRVIPVVKPPENQTYNFTRTISGLYLARKDYKSIATKKIALFLEYVRSKFRISTEKSGEEFYQRLSALSGNSVEEIKELWAQMKKIQKQEVVSEEDLLELNKSINAFKRTNNGK